jgi:hypothetical protein
MARHTFTLAILALLALVWITPVGAQGPGDCAHVYTVQEGDWLSKLARQYLDDPAAYPAIDLATDAAAAGDSSFQAIADPDRIEVGWKLCIPSREAAAGLIMTGLKNAEYRSGATESGTAPLVDGEYSETPVPGSASVTVVQLTEHVAFGYLDGQPAAAVILVTTTGGSGTFYDLAVLVERDGQLANIAITPLGDRVQIRSFGIEGDEIVVEMIAHGPDDPMCCPTQHVRQTYVLQGDQLVPTSSQVVGLPDVGSVTIDTMGLPYPYQPVLVAATPYDASMPPGPMGLPEHIQVLFGVTDPVDASYGDPILYIIPVDEYVELWNEAGNESVANSLAMLEDLLVNKPDLAQARIPRLPHESYVVGGAGGEVLGVQRQYLDTPWGGGVRQISSAMQSPNPITNRGLMYVEQGLTDDGKYLVSFYYPVATVALPDSSEHVSKTEMDQVNSDWAAYREERQVVLDALPASDWDPDLTTMDAVIGSLKFGDYGR